LKGLGREELFGVTKLGPVSLPTTRSDLDEVVTLLERQKSVNLVMPSGTDWRPALEALQAKLKFELPLIDLENPVTTTRAGLVGEILRAAKVTATPPKRMDKLQWFGEQMGKAKYTQLAIAHFDLIEKKKRWDEYGVDFFHALRYYIMTDKKLGLLLISRKRFAELLPTDHPLSHIDITTVELRAAK
jgi:hypothetical protein